MERIYQGSLTRQLLIIAAVSALAPLGILSLFHAFAVPYAVPCSIALALCVSLGFAWQSSQVLSGQLEQLIYLCQAVMVGDHRTRATLSSRSPFYAVADVIHAMLDTLAADFAQQPDQGVLQATLHTLAEEVGEIAAGDLTVEVHAATDLPTVLTQALNTLVGQLRLVMVQVHDATTRMRRSANDMQFTVEHLAAGNNSQAAQIVDSAAALDEMVLSIEHVAQNATLSARVTEQALHHTRLGATAVHATLQSMQRVQDQVQRTTSRIRSLGTRSQAIGAIVQLLGDIADRTSVLALNASIEAALAGEAGQGFGIVAKEVERLAERAAEASQQITPLLQEIQHETNGATTDMESSSHEVGTGVQVVTQAEEALEEVERTVAQLHELIQAISRATTQQTRGSNNLSQAMGAMSEVTQQTVTEAQQVVASVQHLATLAATLRQAVETFKLPLSTTPGNEG